MNIEAIRDLVDRMCELHAARGSDLSDNSLPGPNDLLAAAGGPLIADSEPTSARDIARSSKWSTLLTRYSERTFVNMSLREIDEVAGDHEVVWFLVWALHTATVAATTEPRLFWPPIFDGAVQNWLCAKVEGAGFTDRVSSNRDLSGRYSLGLRWATIAAFGAWYSRVSGEPNSHVAAANAVVLAYRREIGLLPRFWVYHPTDDRWPDAGPAVGSDVRNQFNTAVAKAGAGPGDRVFIADRTATGYLYATLGPNANATWQPLPSDQVIRFSELPEGDAMMEARDTDVASSLREEADVGGRELSDLLKTASAQPEPVNRILYGPPGTGKTYTTTAEALRLCGIDTNLINDAETQRFWFEHLKNHDRIEVVTFHPAYEYEDFIGGLRPNVTEGGSDGQSDSLVGYDWKPGAFHRACTEASRNYHRRRARHPSALTDEQKSTAPHAPNKRRLDPVDSPPLQHVFVIDEINRGNIPRIFGELLTLIEPNKRHGMSEATAVRLPGAPDSHDPFTVPRNLHILGTMNTADRSIALMDVALRRRFDFVELMPDPEVVRTTMVANGLTAADPFGLVKTTVELMKTINKRIEFLYDRDHTIGHAYFCNVKSWEDLRRAMLDKVIPLLQEYFYGSWDRVCAVLGCPYTADGKPARKLPGGAAQSQYEAPMITVEVVNELEVLGFDHDDFENKLSYSINKDFRKAAPGAELAKDDEDLAKDDAELAKYFRGVLSPSASSPQAGDAP